MSLAAEISKLRFEPRRLSVTATCVMDEVEGKGHLVVASNLEVSADVPGLDEADVFHEAVERADAGCPISTLIRGKPLASRLGSSAPQAASSAECSSVAG